MIIQSTSSLLGVLSYSVTLALGFSGISYEASGVGAGGAVSLA
jgi:hypothetical protein